MTDANPVSEFTKIGNYAVPAFGAFITAALAVTGSEVAVIFGLYTMIATLIAYGHRLAWLRRRNRPQDGANLPISAIVIVFVLHSVLLGALAIRLWSIGKL